MGRGETAIWDQLVADMSTERLFQYIMRDDYPDWSMEQFLGQCLPTKDGEDWSAQLARELGVSSATVRNHVEAPEEKYREDYLAIAVCLKLDVEDANRFLTKMAKASELYLRNVSDAPYLRLIHDRARFENECPRRKGESIPDWVRRAMPECFLEKEADALEEWLRPFFKKKGWKHTQLANDIGTGKDELRHSERRCFAGSRQLALATAASLGMTEDETDCLLSMCWNEPCLERDRPLDALFLELINEQTIPKNARKWPKRQSGEPILAWAQRVGGNILEEYGSKAPSDDTAYYWEVMKIEPLQDARRIVSDTSDSRTLRRKALPIFQEWIGDTKRDKAMGASSWLSKNAGNRRWRSQGFQSREVKRSWDKLRRAIEVDEKPVSRDELIRMGLLLRMDLRKMNEVLSVCGYREIHSNNGNIFEYYLFRIWKEFSDYFYSDGKMPEENLSIDTDRAIPDLQLYFSQKIDQYFQPMKEYFQKEKERQREYREAGKQPPTMSKRLRQYQRQQKHMPQWYLAKEDRKKRYRRLRAEAIEQALREYPRICKEEDGKVRERLTEINREGVGYAPRDKKDQERDEFFVRQELEADGEIFNLTLEGSIDCSLDVWGFKTLGDCKPQKAADAQLLWELRRLPPRPEEKQMENLYSLARSLYEKGEVEKWAEK